MPDRTEWRGLIRAAAQQRATPLIMTTFIGKPPGDSASKPVKVLAEDGRIYLVKGRQNSRMIVNEQIVAELSAALGAPVPPVVYIDVPKALIAAEPEMQHMSPGVSHGSQWLDGCTDREGLAYTDEPENRDRFARLAVLYTWVGAGDQQWIYEKTTPHRVYSVDHGHFFPGGPNWTSAGLDGASDPLPDPGISLCNFEPSEFVDAIAALRSISPAAIARAVARPWPDWQIDASERVDVAEYLYGRRRMLVCIGTF